MPRGNAGSSDDTTDVQDRLYNRVGISAACVGAFTAMRLMVIRGCGIIVLLVVLVLV